MIVNPVAILAIINAIFMLYGLVFSEHNINTNAAIDIANKNTAIINNGLIICFVLESISSFLQKEE